jgi:hypothetical protein
MAKFLKCGSKWGGKLAAVVECGKFCSDANDMTCLMMVDRVRMAPLMKSSSLQLDK